MQRSLCNFDVFVPSLAAAINANLLPVLILLALFNATLPAALTAISQRTLFDALLSGLGQSFVVWFSIMISITLWRKSSVKVNNSSTITSVALLLSFGLTIPIATINWLVCACYAMLWLSQCRSEIYARAAAILLLATALRDPATKLLLTLFADQILSIDTWLAYFSLAFLDSGSFSIQDNLISQTGGYDLLILTGCSAFVNLSLALLLWLALSLLRKPIIDRLDLVFGGLVAFSVIGLNTARLALMAIDNDWYLLLHEGDGATVIELAALLFASLPTIGRVYYEKYFNYLTNDDTRTRIGTDN